MRGTRLDATDVASRERLRDIGPRSACRHSLPGAKFVELYRYEYQFRPSSVTLLPAAGRDVHGSRRGGSDPLPGCTRHRGQPPTRIRRRYGTPVHPPRPLSIAKLGSVQLHFSVTVWTAPTSTARDDLGRCGHLQLALHAAGYPVLCNLVWRDLVLISRDLDTNRSRDGCVHSGPAPQECGQHAAADPPAQHAARPSTRGAGSAGWELRGGPLADPRASGRDPPEAPGQRPRSTGGAIARPRPVAPSVTASSLSAFAHAPAQRRPSLLGCAEPVDQPRAT